MQDYKITRLQDNLLSNCCGGQGEYDGLVWRSLGISVVSAVVAGGCLISRAVKSAKSKKARAEGDFSLAAEYDKSIKKLDKSAVIASGITAAGLAAMFVSAEASNKPSLYVYNCITSGKMAFYSILNERSSTNNLGA